MTLGRQASEEGDKTSNIVDDIWQRGADFLVAEGEKKCVFRRRRGGGSDGGGT